jgi:RND family efflux transporter MFP subunit
LNTCPLIGQKKKFRSTRRLNLSAYNPPRMSSHRNQKIRMTFSKNWKRGIAACALLGAMAAGCSKAPQQGPPPPISVTVSHPIQHIVVQWDQYDGHVESPGMVDVEAQVSGQIVAAPFKEGEIVHKGQTLFRIYALPFQATLEGKQADMAKSDAQMESAQTDYDRYADALKSHAVSQQVYDNAKFAFDSAKAQYESDKAAVVLAKNNLDWCDVTAPISGRVGNYGVTVGNVVTSGVPTPTVLTTIQSVDPMYCYVDVDEASVQRYAKLAALGQQLTNVKGQVPCYLQLDNETGFPHIGYIDFKGNHIDAGTGTMQMRGVFPNPDGTLLPGNHALMRVAGSPLESTLLVPDEAIGTSQNTRYVLVAMPDGSAVSKPVMMGALFAPLRAIVSGLDPDDQVIINGQARVIPGRTPVAPTEAPIQYDPKIFELPKNVRTTQSATEPETEPATESATQPATATPDTSPATDQPGAGK